MTILSALHSSRIRNRSMGVLHLIAADESCEVSDILALITPSQPIPQAPAARTYPPAPVDVQAEEVSQATSSVTQPPEPRTTSTSSVQAQASSAPSFMAADVPSTSLLGAEGTVDPAIITEPSGPAPGSDAAPKADTDKPVEPSGSAAPTRGRPATIRAKIVVCHEEHPTWPSKLIAEHLGISEDAVRAGASRKKLKLVSWWDYQRTLPTEQRTVPAKPVPAEPSNRDRVREAHAAHPDFAAKEMAFHLGMDELNVRAVASQIGIKLPKAKSITPPARITLADKIRAHLVEHPDATLADIAAATGHRIQAVGWAAQKAKITLRKYTAEERSEASLRAVATRTQGKPQEPVERAGPPTPRAEPKQPPASTPVEPFDDDEPAPVPRKVNRAPTGRFYLRDKATGHYVHQSLQQSATVLGPMMTSDRKWAWYDTMDRYRGAKKLWPQLVEMRKEGA